MHTLVDDEVREWLASRGIRQAPYESDYSEFDGYYEQVKIPTESARMWAFASGLINASAPFERALLHFTDWALYTPDQMAIISAVRASQGEQRWLVDVPGHVFDAEEKDLLIGMLGLAMTFGWTVYLYFENGPTFLVWDGELLDMWVPEKIREEVLKWINGFIGPR